MSWIKRLLLSLLLLLGAGFGRRLFSFSVELVEKRRKTFLTWHERPRDSGMIGTWSDPVARPPRLAIILQGPLLQESDFTLESVRIYRKHFPDSQVIVSTWDSESMDQRRALEDSGAVVISSGRPGNPGLSNVNYQIISTRAGLTEAGKNGATWVIKSRTDQRFYAPNLGIFLAELVGAFPPAVGYRQKSRIVTLSLNSFKFRYYSLSDFFQFGYLEDLNQFWSCPLDERDPKTPVAWDFYEHAKQQIAESYLYPQYLKSVGRSLAWTMEDSWRAIGDHFIVVNTQDLDFFWPKYSAQEFRWIRYDMIPHTQEWTFREWLIQVQNQFGRTPPNPEYVEKLFPFGS